MAGLFDFLRDNPAITQGLLAGGFGAMAGRGSKLQAWGQGGLAGLQGYGNALNSQAQEQDRALAAKRAGIQEQMLQMQLENAQRQQAGQKATQDYLTQALSPVQPIDANAVSGVMGPRPEALKPVGTTPGFNVGSALKAGVPVDSLGQIQQMLAPKAADYKVVGDSLVKIGPDGVSPVFQATPKEDLNSLIVRGPDGKPQINQLAFDVKRTLAQAGATNVSYGAPVAGVDNEGKPVFFQPAKGGGAPSIISGVAPDKTKDKDLTEAQAKATAFLGQMRSASDTLKNIGADQSALSMQAETALAGGPANAVIGQKAQRVRQSQDQWAEAFLRFKTGAASTPAEVSANRKMFFPVLGDSPEVISQKGAMRNQAEIDMEVAAGRGAAQMNARQPRPTGLPSASDIDAELARRRGR